MNDQNLLALYISGTLLMVVFAVMMVVFLIINKQRQARAKLEKQEMEFNYKASLIRSKMEMQEQALSYVSQEIHDNVGQVLSFSCMQLANVQNKMEESKEKKLLSDNLEIIRQAVKELRLLSHSLNTSLVEKRDLEDAIETELNRVRSFSGMTCVLEKEEHIPDLSPETRLLAFRIVQEALQNVVKHAGAKLVKIHMAYENGILRLRITDNGRGINPQNLGGYAKVGKNGTHSLGMANMYQRALLLNGSLEVTSDGRTGTDVLLSIPAK